MIDYTNKSYGRNDEIKEIFWHFGQGKDISKHGHRRLGKTFILDRLVEQGPSKGYICTKVEIAGCRDSRAVFQRLVTEINEHRKPLQWLQTLAAQRISQVVSPRTDGSGPWYQGFVQLDWQGQFDRILRMLNRDKNYKWAILVDELPIFLKTLHDKGDAGIKEALDFMNLLSQIRAKYPKIRWLVTGSIGIDPLARAGNYMGVMAKFTNFPLYPLSIDQSVAFLQDIAANGDLQRRNHITVQEANAIIDAVGWRAAFYLEAFAAKLDGEPKTDKIGVKEVIERATKELLIVHNASTFGTWEEHIRKHYNNNLRTLAFAVLNTLALHENGATVPTIMQNIAPQLADNTILMTCLESLENDGFIYKNNNEDEEQKYCFRIAILRLWWKKFPAKEI